MVHCNKLLTFQKGNAELEVFYLHNSFHPPSKMSV